MLLACVHAPTLGPVAPFVEAPPPPPIEDLATDCPAAVDVDVGAPPPYLGPDGSMSCSGLMVPESLFVEILHDADVAMPHYRAQAMDCPTLRAADQRRAGELVQRARQQLPPVWYVLGPFVIVGAGSIGYGIGQVVP